MSEQSALLRAVLSWLSQNNYRRASFDRLISIVPGAATYEQLNMLIRTNPSIFRAANLKGGYPGLALLDNVNPATLLTPAETGTPLNLEEAEMAGPTPRRVTLDDVEAEIVHEHYLNVGEAIHAMDMQAGRPTQVLPRSLGLLTICVLTLRNGFTVTGKSACVDPNLYNQEIGQQLARKQAVEHIWPFLGFRLADDMNLPKVSMSDVVAPVPALVQAAQGILRNSDELPHHPV